MTLLINRFVSLLTKWDILIQSWLFKPTFTSMASRVTSISMLVLANTLTFLLVYCNYTD